MQRIRDFVEEHLGAIVIAVVFLIIAAGIAYLKLNTYRIDVRVVSLGWQRMINVEVYKTLHQDTELLWMPGDAYNVTRYRKSVSKPYSYSCDNGKSTCSGVNSVTEDWAKYDIDRWVYDHSLSSSHHPHRCLEQSVSSGAERYSA